MKSRKAPEGIVLEMLSKLFSEYLEALKVPVARQNANVILIHKGGRCQSAENFSPIGLLAVVYKLFTDVTA